MVDIFSLFSRALRNANSVADFSGPQFQIASGAVNVAAVTGSPSHAPNNKRGIVVPTHADGLSSNFRHYGLAPYEAGPEVNALLARIKKIGRVLDQGEVFLARHGRNIPVLFASTFDYPENAAAAIRQATFNALRAAKSGKLKHLDFVVMDGGFGPSPKGRGLDEVASARAMAQGMLDYAQTGGKVTAAVVQLAGRDPEGQQIFAETFNDTLDAGLRANVRPQRQPSAATAAL